jgi:putative flippase GtrA
MANNESGFQDVIRDWSKVRRVHAQARPGWPAPFSQAFRFGLVGVLNTLVDGLVYLLLTRWLGFGSYPTLAKAVSYSCGVLNSYFWNRSWTFHSRARVRKTLFAFAAANLLALVVNAGVMSVCLTRLRLPEGAAFAAATAATMLWNFIWSKFVIFKE